MIERQIKERIPRLVSAAIMGVGMSYVMYWFAAGQGGENPWQTVSSYLFVAYLFSDWKADRYKPSDKGD